MTDLLSSDLATLRAWWAHRQGLDGSLLGSSPAEILTRSGWARSVGGSSPYLTLRARGGHDRATVDRAGQDLAIHELPSARGCTYILPADDFALGLRVGTNAPDAELAQAIKHLGVTAVEIDALGDAILSIRAPWRSRSGTRCAASAKPGRSAASPPPCRLRSACSKHRVSSGASR